MANLVSTILNIGHIYIIYTTDGRKFCAKVTSKDDTHVVFTARMGEQSLHAYSEITFARLVE